MRKFIWAVVIIAVLAIVVVAVVGSKGDGNNTATSPQPTSENTTVKFGQEAKTDSLVIVVQKPKKKSQQFTGAQYCTTVSYRNISDSPQSFNPFDWKFRTSDGVEASAGIPFGGKPLNSGELRPGGTVRGAVCADNTVDNVSEVVYSGSSEIVFSD